MKQIKDEKPGRTRILEDRRLRNIESAKRSRERLRREPEWLEIQMRENEDRIKVLEKTIGGLEEELNPKPRRKTERTRHPKHSGKQSSVDKRPEWFGEPF